MRKIRAFIRSTKLEKLHNPVTGDVTEDVFDEIEARKTVWICEKCVDDRCFYEGCGIPIMCLNDLVRIPVWKKALSAISFNHIEKFKTEMNDYVTVVCPSTGKSVHQGSYSCGVVWDNWDCDSCLSSSNTSCQYSGPDIPANCPYFRERKSAWKPKKHRQKMVI